MAADKHGKILEGQRFGRLVAVRFLGHLPNAKWLFLCDCGTEKDVFAALARSGKTRSCGCLAREISAGRCRERNLTHAMRYTPEYKIWGTMIRRCHAEADPGYRRYGARGIHVCDRWRYSFERFFSDVGQRPSPQHSIDRYPDNDGDYEPGNVRWATRLEQANNRRSNHMVTYRGHPMTLRAAIRAAGDVADKGTVHYRLTRLGWETDRAVETPSPSRS